MPNIFLNNTSIVLETLCSLESFINTYINTQKPFAVAVNKAFIPKHQYRDVMLKEADYVDVVEPMVGG